MESPVRALIPQKSQVAMIHGALGLLLALLSCTQAWAAGERVREKTISLTFDDGLNPVSEPRAPGWNAGIVASLQRHHIKAMVFPCLKCIGGDPGMRLMEDWSRGKHRIGNHTSKHRSLAADSVSLAEFIQDVSDADQKLRVLPGCA